MGKAREPHEILAENLRSIAEKRGLALTVIADLAGVGRSQMWAVLRCETSPTVSWLDKVAAVLEVEVHDLLRAPSRPTRKR